MDSGGDPQEDIPPAGVGSVAGESPHGWVARGIAGTRVLLLRGLALRAISLATSLALVALVAPGDLGLFAVVRGAIGLIQFASELGLELALIRRHDDPTREQLAAVVGQRTLVLVAIGGAAAVVPGGSTLFGLVPAEYADLMLLAVGSLLLTPLAGACRIVLERSLQFTRLSLVEVNVVLLQNVGLVLFAIGGHFREGIFLVQVVSSVYATAALRWVQAVPGPSFNLRPLRALWADSLGFAGSALLGRLLESVTPLLIARFFGLDIAGFWHFAGRVGQFLQVLLDAYSRAAVAVAGRLVKDLALLRFFAAEILHDAAAVVYPVLGLLYTALPLVGAWFPRWADGVQVAQLYVVALGLLGVVHVALWPVAVARSGSRVAVAQSLLSVATVWIGLLVLWLAGSENVAVPFAAELALSVAFMIGVTRGVMRPSFWRLVWRPLLAVVFCVAVAAIGRTLGWPPWLPAVIASVPCALLLLDTVFRRWAAGGGEPHPALSSNE